MIAFVEGKIAEKEPTHVIIDVGGIGYHIHISLQTFSEIKSFTAVKLFTYLHVKADSQTSARGRRLTSLIRAAR